jgi:hypothetical protein
VLRGANREAELICYEGDLLLAFNYNRRADSKLSSA